MPITMPSISAPPAPDRGTRSASVSSQARSTAFSAALWIVLAMIGVTGAANVLLSAWSDSATQTPTWLVGP
jgi:hypothetical protein